MARLSWIGGPPAPADGYDRTFYRRRPSAVRVIGMRLALIAALLLAVSLSFWAMERDHIKDTNSDGEFSYLDALYFTIVTVTTVGYGDIVPVTEEARMFDAFIITPVRIIVWLLFIGTAYQFVIERYWEDFRMKREMNRMKGHVIIAGCGSTSEAAVKELVSRGYGEDNLVIVDTDAEKLQSLVELGATGVKGDPTTEKALERAGISRASTIIVATDRDDTNVLIALTARDMNRGINIVSRVSQEENIKLLERAGCNVIISPSIVGGNLMAMAVFSHRSVTLISDMLTASSGSSITQRAVTTDEEGKRPGDVSGGVVIGVIRGDKVIGPKDLDGVKLKSGDKLIILR